MVFRISLILVFLPPLPVLASACPGHQVSGSSIVVEFNRKNKLLKVAAKQHSLNEVLARVTKETGVEFIGDAGRCDPVSIEFDYLALDRALAKLLTGRNYVVQAESGREAMRVWLVPAGTGNSVTETEILRDTFYRQLQGTKPIEDLAEQIRRLEFEQR